MPSDLVASLAGPYPPGILWTGGTAHHHKHFRNCSYHRKHKPLCYQESPHRGRPLYPLDDLRSRTSLYRSCDDGSSLNRRRLALLWSRRPTIRRGNFIFSTRNLKKRGSPPSRPFRIARLCDLIKPESDKKRIGNAVDRISHFLRFIDPVTSQTPNYFDIIDTYSYDLYSENQIIARLSSSNSISFATQLSS